MGVLPGIGQYFMELLISVGFAFLIGLEIYVKTDEDARKYLFGTDRTFSLIALLGFILLKANGFMPGLYITGMAVLTSFLLVHYFRKVHASENRGITGVILALLVYIFPLVIQQFPLWFSMLTIVMVLVLIELKPRIREFSKKVYTEDFVTLAKFVLLSGVILPLVPDREIITGVPISPYKLWLAIVVISAISYLSYLLRKFVFPNAGLLMTGILGGLYSSTATTFIIAKKSKEQIDAPAHYAAAILAATTLMFARVFILVVIFNGALSVHLLPWFSALFVTGAVATFFTYRAAPKPQTVTPTEDIKHQNPLELGVALVFGILYVVFSLLTQYTMQYYGHSGLSALSFIVGFTDIDPFLLNMFQGKYAGITVAIISAATLQAIASNNLLKMVYAVILGDKAVRKYILMGFGAIIVVNILLLFLL